MTINPAEWMQLQAYIDCEISAKEAEKIEKELLARPDLRHALHRLERQKHAIKLLFKEQTDLKN